MRMMRILDSTFNIPQQNGSKDCSTIKIDWSQFCLHLIPFDIKVLRHQFVTKAIQLSITFAQYKLIWVLISPFRISELIYTHLSNKRDVMLTDLRKFHPAQKENPPCTFIDFITKLWDILTEPNDGFYFILAQKLTEKVQLILQLLQSYMFIPTSTVI